MALKSNKEAVQSGQGNDDLMGRSGLKREVDASPALISQQTSGDKNQNANDSESEEDLPPEYTYSAKDPEKQKYYKGIQR